MPELGGLDCKTDVKILICYMLAYVRKPLSLMQISDALASDDIVNYFDLAEAWSELQSSGHILPDGNDKFVISQAGIEVGAAFERKLPITIREKAVKSTLRMLSRAERDAETPCTVKAAEGGGYNVTCTVADGSAPLMSVTLWVADMASADSIITHFRSNPTLAYTGVVALMTGDINTVGGILTSSPNDI